MGSKPVPDPFAAAMTNLRAHRLKCRECRAAISMQDMQPPCVLGWTLCVQVARSCEQLLKTKRHAVSTINGYVYACPEIAAHGEAFALTAQPMAVAGIQGELF